MLTLTITCNRFSNEDEINSVLGLGGYSGMQKYCPLTGNVVLTIQSDEVHSEIGFLSIVVEELHKQNIQFNLTNEEV